MLLSSKNLFVRGVVFSLVGVAVGGCGQSAPKAYVSGTVRHAGKPVVSGVVTIIDPSRGRPDTAMIADGKFVFETPVSPGKFSATLAPESEYIDPGSQAAGYWKEKDAADIPKKFRSMATSGLQYTLVPGKNELTIDLD